MLNKYQNEWANYIVKTEETELLLVDRQKHIQLETFGLNKTTANSTYKKLAVQWLNEVLCFGSSFVIQSRSLRSAF